MKDLLRRFLFWPVMIPILIGLGVWAFIAVLSGTIWEAITGNEYHV